MKLFNEDGVAATKVTVDKTGTKTSTDTVDMGKAWPRKQKNDGSAQEEFADSKHGNADDGITSSVGDKASGLKSKQTNTGGNFEKVGKGTMGEGTDRVAQLFEAYANDYDVLSHAQFQDLCSIYKLGHVSREHFENLLAGHDTFLFTEGSEDNWFKQNIMNKDKDGDESEESEEKEEKEEKDCDEDDSCDESVEREAVEVQEAFNPADIAKKMVGMDNSEEEDEEAEKEAEDGILENHTSGLAANASASDKGILNPKSTTAKKPNPAGKTAIKPTVPTSAGKAEDGITSKNRSGDLGGNASMVNVESIDKNINRATLRSNVYALSMNAKKFLESKLSKLKGEHTIGFTVKSEGFNTKNSNTIAEAMADVEEVMQTGNSPEVEAVVADSSGTVIMVQQVPLLTITPRGVLTHEGKPVFRHKTLAESMAKRCAEAGVTTRITGCNWGYTVIGKVPAKVMSEGVIK